ncbi:hypothetical protein [Micromonospora tarensis]|uniref:Secreted protein n=1 Tax=Micromonospora tarensis TaxID=2806100 RepID=A0ABS1YCA1_9ACTN|nr:hypothetical protein [Micromonospora tarensis]MBM0275020.1 hypothetical protein [Micromonospora tarensis]
MRIFAGVSAAITFLAMFAPISAAHASAPNDATSAQEQGTPGLTNDGRSIVIQSCYGNAKSYDAYNDYFYWPVTGYARTTTACSDINIKPTDRGIYVAVCFRRTGTCNGYKWAAQNSWTVIATNVLDGTDYWLDFTGVSRGQVAA